MIMAMEQLVAQWDSGDSLPYKGSLINLTAYEDDPENPSCMCAQGQILHYVGGWGFGQLAEASQSAADKAVAELLGISRGQSIFLRKVNDRIAGPPSNVLTAPEKLLGEHAQLVLAFFRRLDSMTAVGWAAVATAFYGAAYDTTKMVTYDASWDATRAAVWEAAGDAAYNTACAPTGASKIAVGAFNEIQGHKILGNKGTPLFFIPMFGFNTIKDLADWGKGAVRGD